MAAKAQSASKPAQGNILFIFAYLLGWLSGILVFIIAGQDKRLKFHALQAILWSIGVTVVWFILEFIPFVNIIAWLVVALAWLYGLYIGFMAFSENKDIDMPVVATYAHQYAK